MVSTHSLNCVSTRKSSIRSISMSSRSSVASGSSEVSEHLATASLANHHPSTYTSCHHHPYHRDRHQGKLHERMKEKMDTLTCLRYFCMWRSSLFVTVQYFPIFNCKTKLKLRNFYFLPQHKNFKWNPKKSLVWHSLLVCSALPESALSYFKLSFGKQSVTHQLVIWMN